MPGHTHDLKNSGNGKGGELSEGKISPAPARSDGLRRVRRISDLPLIAQIGDSGDIPLGAFRAIRCSPGEQGKPLLQAVEKANAGFFGRSPLLSGSFHDSEPAPDPLMHDHEDSRIADLRKFGFDD